MWQRTLITRASIIRMFSFAWMFYYSSVLLLQWRISFCKIFSRLLNLDKAFHAMPFSFWSVNTCLLTSKVFVALKGFEVQYLFRDDRIFLGTGILLEDVALIYKLQKYSTIWSSCDTFTCKIDKKDCIHFLYIWWIFILPNWESQWSIHRLFN